MESVIDQPTHTIGDGQSTPGNLCRNASRAVLDIGTMHASSLLVSIDKCCMHSCTHCLQLTCLFVWRVLCDDSCKHLLQSSESLHEQCLSFCFVRQKVGQCFCCVTTVIHAQHRSQTCHQLMGYSVVRLLFQCCRRKINSHSAQGWFGLGFLHARQRHVCLCANVTEPPCHPCWRCVCALYAILGQPVRKWGTNVSTPSRSDHDP